MLQNQVMGWRDRKGRISLFALPDDRVRSGCWARGLGTEEQKILLIPGIVASLESRLNQDERLSRSLGDRQAWAPTLLLRCTCYVTQISDYTSLSLHFIIYKAGMVILTSQD